MATAHMDWHQFLLLLLLSQVFPAWAISKVYKENCKSMDDAPADLKAAITAGTNIALAADLPIDPLECGSFLHVMQTVCELSSKGDISSKMFALSCDVGRQLQALFDALKIKYEKHEFFSNCLEMDYQKATVRSDLGATVRFMHDMMDKLNGNKMIIITDLDSDFIRKELAIHYLSAVIINATDIDAKFHENLKYHGAHFFVLCTPKTTRKILTTVDKKVLFSPQSWIILTDMPYELLMDGLDIPYNTRVAVATSSANKAAKVLPPNAALLWTSENKQTASCANLNTASTQKTELGKPTAKKVDLELELIEVYTVKEGEPMIYKQFGAWFSTRRLQLKRPFPNRLRALTGVTLRVVTIESPPYIIFKDGNKTNEALEGFYGLLFKDLATEMNFSYVLDIQKVYGIKNEKGEWDDGLFKRLKDQKADIGVCDLSVTIDRKEIVEYSSTISSGNLRLVYRIPDEKYYFRLYIVPFGWEIWLLVLASIILSGVLLYITNRVSPKSALQSTTDPTELAKVKHQFSMLDCIFAIYNGFNQQGTDLEPREVSGKIIFITVYLSFVIIFASYTSVFTSFLTIQDEKKFFETLEEALGDKSYQFGVIKNTNYETVFKDETDTGSLLYKTWQRIVKDKENLVGSVSEGLDRAFTKKYVLLVAKESSSYFLRNNCSFDTSKENIFTDYFHFAYRQGFPYAEAFNEYINRLVEGGVTARLDSQYQRDKINFCESEGVKPLGFKKVVSLYLLLAGASLFAAAALSIEWLFRLSEGATRKPRQPAHSFIVKTIQDQTSKPIMHPPLTAASSYKTYYYS